MLRNNSFCSILQLWDCKKGDKYYMRDWTPKQLAAIDLLACGEASAAVATKVGIAPRTIWYWRANPEFREAVRKRMNEALEQALGILNAPWAPFIYAAVRPTVATGGTMTIFSSPAGRAPAPGRGGAGGEAGGELMGQIGKHIDTVWVKPPLPAPAQPPERALPAVEPAKQPREPVPA